MPSGQRQLGARVRSRPAGPASWAYCSARYAERNFKANDGSGADGALLGARTAIHSHFTLMVRQAVG